MPKKFAHFRVGKKQFFAGDDERGGLCPAAHNRQRRQIAGRDYQMKQFGRILKQTVNQFMHNRFASDVMIIVEDENKRLFDGLQNFVKQKVNAAFGKTKKFVARFREIRKNSFAEIGREIFDALGDITEKDKRVSVRVVKLIPDGLARLTCHKIGNQRRFAATCISRNHRYRRIQI